MKSTTSHIEYAFEEKRPSVFRRLAKRLSRPPHAINALSSNYMQTPDWLTEPVKPEATQHIPLRSPPTSPVPRASSTFRRRHKESDHREARRMSLFSRSRTDLPRSDSVLSFASADCFTKSPTGFEETSCSSLSVQPPISPSESWKHVRTQSQSEIDNYSLPVRMRDGKRSHRSKISDSSFESAANSLDSESVVLITTQMIDSANIARRSRSNSLSARRSLGEERQYYIGQDGRSWV